MFRIAFAFILAAAAALGYVASQAVAPIPSSARDARVTLSQADLVALQEGDAVIAGVSDRADGAWVLARSDPDGGLVAYHLGKSTERFPLQLQHAGRLGGIALDASGVVWVGARDRVSALDASGTALQTLTLPAVTRPATHEQRAPDGSVLGLGQVTSIAATNDGVWVGRYAASEVSFIDRSGVVREVPLSEDVDVKSFTLDASGTPWFTTNFGPSDQLGAFVGRITPARSLVLTPLIAASLASGPSGIVALARDRKQLDADAHTASTGSLPAEADASASAMTRTGELIVRGAKQSALHVYDSSGVEQRRIDYATGTFIGHGGISYPSTARLQFVFVTPSGTIWFAPEASGFVYRAT